MNPEQLLAILQAAGGTRQATPAVPTPRQIVQEGQRRNPASYLFHLLPAILTMDRATEPTWRGPGPMDVLRQYGRDPRSLTFGGILDNLGLPPSQQRSFEMRQREVMRRRADRRRRERTEQMRNAARGEDQ